MQQIFLIILFRRQKFRQKKKRRMRKNIPKNKYIPNSFHHKFVISYDELSKLVRDFYYFMLRNPTGVIIIGFSKPDSRKSLSPVSRISAYALMAALKIGRSLTSLICNSDKFSSVGIGTNSRVNRAIERNLFNDSSR